MKHPLGRKLSALVATRHGITAVLFVTVLFCCAVFMLLQLLCSSHPAQGMRRPVPDDFLKSPPVTAVRHLTAPTTRLDAPAEVPSLAERISATTAGVEGTFNTALDSSHAFIQLYGWFQTLIDRSVVEDQVSPQYSVVRMDNGKLTFVSNGTANLDSRAASLARFQMAVEERGAKMLYLQAPTKVKPGDDNGLPYGVTDNNNQLADGLLARLEEVGVPTLDFRQTLLDSGTPWDDWFFSTDHHWRPEGAFICFQALCDQLEGTFIRRKGAGGIAAKRLDIDDRLTNPDSYQRTVLEDAFLGSQGKRVGTAYGGVDDITLWVPSFPTLMRYQAPFYQIDRFGSVEETVLFPQRVETRNLFDDNPYIYYGGGDYPAARVYNYYNPSGPRILLLRDSFACPMTPFLAMASSELTTIDLRYFQENLLSYVDWVQPDIVLVMYSPSVIRTDAFFGFFPQQETQQSKKY